MLFYSCDHQNYQITRNETAAKASSGAEQPAFGLALDSVPPFKARIHRPQQQSLWTLQPLMTERVFLNYQSACNLTWLSHGSVNIHPSRSTNLILNIYSYLKGFLKLKVSEI